MAAPADYYETLGVQHDADATAIRDAFRGLALKYHPDRNKAPDAERRFKEIAEAYAVLSDPEKRAEYDLRGGAGTAGFTAQDLFGGIDFEDLLGDLGLGASLFERLFGFDRRPRRGADLEALVEIPLELVLHGGETTVTVERQDRCPACGGSGARPGTNPRPCPACGGSGSKVTRSGGQGGIEMRHITPCPACGGRGRIIDQPCERCQGAGLARRTEDIVLRIPAGIEDGTLLRVAGHGMAPRQAGRPPGDLLVRVHSRADPRFIRRGADLWRQDAIDAVEAVLGTTIIVPSLEGDCRLKIPAGTQPGTVLRLRHKGLPGWQRRERGDLFVAVEVRIPDHLSAEERRLYEALRGLKHPAPAPGHSG